jgi:hypothetical protein
LAGAQTEHKLTTPCAPCPESCFPVRSCCFQPRKPRTSSISVSSTYYNMGSEDKAAAKSYEPLQLLPRCAPFWQLTFMNCFVWNQWLQC